MSMSYYFVEFYFPLFRRDCMKKITMLHTLFSVLALLVFMSAPTFAEVTTNYVYDDLYRLNKVVRSDGTVIEYQYDSSGNRNRKIVTPPSSPLSAAFTASLTSGQAPLAVNFTDTSLGSIVSWSWNFGDGATSSQRNPSHSFVTAGIYTVALTITGDTGSSATGSRTITVTSFDTEVPTITDFTLPASSSSFIIPVNTFVASDNIGISGYMITDSATAPATGDAGWTSSAPSQFTVASSGSKTLYAWAKDAAGNVSASAQATVNVTLADTVLPTVTAFTMPASSNVLTIPVSSFTANDNVLVTGYLITESATKPSAGAAGWSGSAPSQVVTASYGNKTFYAWAKDAAGNVSDAAAPVLVAVTQTATSTTVLFSDDFNDNSIDTSKWIVTRGNARVAEETGIMKLEQNVTDAGGYLQSAMIPFSKDSTISFKRKVKVHYANQYTYHSLVAYLKTDTTPLFNVGYLNTLHYDGSYQSTALNGIYVTSASGVRTKLNNPIWDNWFDEEIIYDPITGQFDYKVNNVLANSVNIGALPTAAENKLFLGL